MCEYCGEYDVSEDIINKSINLLGAKIKFGLYLEEDEIRLCSYGNTENTIDKKKINYCPMCGRKLNTD